MANASKQPRSFNTIRKSQTKERAKRGRISRIVLLAIVGVAALLLMVVLLFGAWSGVAGIVSCAQGCQSCNNLPQNGGGDDFPNANIQYTDATVQFKDTQIGDLILVNDVTGDRHKFEYADDTNALDLVSIQAGIDLIDGVAPFSVEAGTTKMNRVACAALIKMLNQYYDLTGDNSLGIPTNYAYRSSSTQAGFSSAVGYADHQTGYCVALATVNPETKAYSRLTNLEHWVYQNCHKYGFVLRYPAGKDAFTGVKDYEYCLRYVGVAHATYMKANNLCLEEYITLLQTEHTFGNALSITGVDGKFYQVYYVPVTTDPNGITTYQLPSNYEYSLSGDNDGGYIVTVHLSHPKA